MVEPISGNNFFWEFTHLNSFCFEIFLDLFSEHYPDELHIIQLDNGALHKALSLNIPENIILLFQPPYGTFFYFYLYFSPAKTAQFTIFFKK